MAILGKPLLKLFLDDYRPLPPGYARLVTTADECIASLATGTYGHVSLDHDLIETTTPTCSTHPATTRTKLWDRSGFSAKTGDAVLEWMRDADMWPSEIQVHSLSTRMGLDLH
jgi:hypothetical protein